MVCAGVQNVDKSTSVLYKSHRGISQLFLSLPGLKGQYPKRTGNSPRATGSMSAIAGILNLLGGELRTRERIGQGHLLPESAEILERAANLHPIFSSRVLQQLQQLRPHPWCFILGILRLAILVLHT